MDFVKNLEVTHILRGGKRGILLFVSFSHIAYENRYVTHPLYLDTFVTIEKMKLHNYVYNSITIHFSIIFFQKKLPRPNSYKTECNIITLRKKLGKHVKQNYNGVFRKK